MDIRDRGARRRPLPEQVAGHVRELILSGAVRPGEFLETEPIAEAVGVGVEPVREGLLALSGQGFVEVVPRRGFVVAPVSRQDVRDLFWAQAQLASELAGRAAKVITHEQLARVEDLDDDFRHAVETAERDAIADLGHRLHREINLAADSRRLTMMLGSMVRHVPRHFYAATEGGVAAMQADHTELIAALRSRNAAAARAVTERHILRGADGVVRALERRGLWDTPAEVGG